MWQLKMYYRQTKIPDFLLSLFVLLTLAFQNILDTYRVKESHENNRRKGQVEVFLQIKQLTDEGSVQKAKHGESKLNFQAGPSVASKHFAATYHTVGKLAVALIAGRCNEDELICPLCQRYYPPLQVSSG
jgi:hypothetical protein